MAKTRPSDVHASFIRFSSAMQRYEICCSCEWKAFADTAAECEEAHGAHVAEKIKK